ncbi:glycosyltransferase [Clostridium botulinum]|uniref:glycosyltransferase n=1 Tax=Clostridium botulinum TaxID=1491 RepID=UPI001968145D|nr:glycosyltransferase [Clostridium botulinum]MBN1066204.1 glycosyltransferase [Clostridium botulinum]
MDEVLVSIDCITYNHEKYIAQALESFLTQKTNFNFEILIHDDASTDKTRTIVENYHRKYPDIIKPIFQEQNKYSKGEKRISTKYNWPRAQGKYIAICEGDDYWIDEHKLQKQYDYMEKNTDCSMCFHSAKISDVEKGIIGEVKPFEKSCNVSFEDMVLGGGGFCPTASLFLRKKFLENLPQYYMDAHVGDYPLQIYLTTVGNVYYYNEFMSIYRVGDCGSWSNINLNGEKEAEKRIVNVNNDIKLLEMINQETNYIYDNYIQNGILKCKFYIALYKEDFNEIIKPIFRNFYDKIGFCGKIKLNIKYYTPIIYKFMKLIKRKYNK